MSALLDRFPRMVHDLSQKEGKKLSYIVEGADLELDRSVLDVLAEILVHLLRNAIDHGLEPPQERKSAGKPEEGTLKLALRREKEYAVIEVSDDGRGIDPAQIRRICVEKGIIRSQDAEKLSEHELQMLVFRPSVSTSKEVTDVSGRGVGMNTVLQRVRSLGGSVDIASQAGRGTKVTLRLPFTVAVATALLVRAHEDVYAIPSISVERILQVEQKAVHSVGGSTVFLENASDIPLFWLRALLKYPLAQDGASHTVVVLRRGGASVGIVVDHVITQRPILIKRIDSFTAKGFSGATILGDGRAALIIDIDTLL